MMPDGGGFGGGPSVRLTTRRPGLDRHAPKLDTQLMTLNSWLAGRKGLNMRSIVVVLHTTTYAPNNLITLICQDSLTGSSLSGEYREGAWYFVLKVRSDKERVRISFRLSQEISMKEDPFEIDVTKDLYHFYEGPVTFSVSDDKKRHIHHIDCIVTEDNDFQRRFIPSNLDENIEYDAIVIGSGMGGGILADQLSDNELNVLGLPTPKHCQYAAPEHGPSGDLLPERTRLRLAKGYLFEFRRKIRLLVGAHPQNE